MKSENKMNKMAVLILAMLCCMLLVVPANAMSVPAEQTDDSLVRMGYFEFGGMFEGASENAEKSGYCYEYMMEVSTYTGWRYEYVYGTYSELYEKLVNGEIDILPYTNYNDKRSLEVKFSNKVLLDEEYYIGIRKGTDRSLKNATISTLEGADYNDLLKQYNIDNDLNLDIKYYPSLEETWNALRNGTVQATVITSNAYSNDNWDYVGSFGKKPTYIAVNNNREDLLKELNEVTELIDTDYPSLMGELYSKYFKDNPMRQSLSDEEIEWVNNHKVLHVGGFNNDAPYLFTIDNNTKKATGLTVDVINGIIERLNLGITADYQGYDTLAQMEEALDRGDIDVIIPFYPSYSIAQEHDFVISNVVRVSNMELVYKKGTSYNEALKKVATPATKLGIYYVKDEFPESEIVGAQSIQDAVDKVLSGEATGAIAQNVVMHNTIEKYDNLSSVVLSEGCGTCFATKTENYILIRILNRGLNYFSDAEIQSISSLYTLEPNVTTREYLKTHKEAVIAIVIVCVSLAALFIAFVQMAHSRQRAAEANRSKTEFLFNMSHDIRTPMNAITGFTSLAKKYSGDEVKVKDYLNKIDSSSQQLLTLINQVLEMSRIEYGKIELDEVPTDVVKEFNSLVTILSEQASNCGLEFNFKLENVKHEYVLADIARMDSITLNITGNSMKYTPKGGKIDFNLQEIESRKEGYATYKFTVQDTGIGMSEEFIKHLYEPFTREKTSTVSKIQGAGLGMSIVKSLVDILGGTIDVQSTLGKGTKFEIVIDFKIIDAIEVNKHEAIDIDKEVFKGMKLLLVEDNEMNREIAIDVLEEYGFSVETAEDGVVSVDRLREKGPDYYDAILMDIQMPIMNGYDATKAIRAMYPNKHIPIVALSANAFAEDRLASMNAGMDDHIAKPVDFEELVQVLAKYIKKN